MVGRLDGCMVEWMDGWMNGRMLTLIKKEQMLASRVRIILTAI